jgi:hypothetical protein
MGSVVADCDRRAVWTILAMGLAAMTLLGLVDWLTRPEFGTDPPFIAVGMAIAAGLAIAVVLLRDLAALRKVERIAADDSLHAQPGIAPPLTPDGRLVDLGLGEDQHARVAPGSYRERDRALALVIGSPASAIEAVRRARTRGVLGIALLAGVFLFHGFASTEDGRIAFDEVQCELGSEAYCRAAAIEISRSEHDPLANKRIRHLLLRAELLARRPHP